MIISWSSFWHVVMAAVTSKFMTATKSSFPRPVQCVRCNWDDYYSQGRHLLGFYFAQCTSKFTIEGVKMLENSGILKKKSDSISAHKESVFS